MSAIRLARGATGRPKIVKFAGCYHGHVDALLAAAGSGVATLGLPDSPGRHRGRGQRDDRAALQRPRRGRGGLRRATATRSPRSSPRRRPATWAWCRPAPGFNAGLAELAHRARRAADPRRGDDRLPGVPRRLGRLGRARPVDADLFTFGKVMGGGLPAAAFGGRAEIMSPARPGRAGLPGRHAVRQPAGLRGRAGHAAGLHRRGLRASSTRPRPPSASWPSAALTAAGVPHRLQQRRQHVLDLLHRRRRCTDYDAARTQDVGAFRAFFHAMLARGVYLPPSAFEAWFVSAAIDDDALDDHRRRPAARRPGRGRRARPQVQA